MKTGNWLDLLALLGLAMFLAGLWWIYPPVALIAGGVILGLVGLIGARMQGMAEAAEQEKQERQRQRREAE